MQKSLRASPEGIDSAEKALKISKTELAKTIGIARSTLINFFTGKPIDEEIFIQICKRLGLSVKETAEGEQSDGRVHARTGRTRSEELKFQAVILQIHAILEAEYGEAIANGQPAPSLEEAINTLAHQR